MNVPFAAERHQHRLQHQGAGLMLAHRPTHDDVRAQVLHPAQIQPAFRRLDIGDIGCPFLVGHLGPEVSLQVVLHSGWSLTRGLLLPAPLLRNALEAICPHQAGYAVLAAADALIVQLIPDAQGTHYTITLSVITPDLQQKLFVRPGTGAGLPDAPVIIVARRDPKTTTHHSNRERIAATFDHTVLHFDAFAKNAAASCKKPVPFSPAPAHA